MRPYLLSHFEKIHAEDVRRYEEFFVPYAPGNKDEKEVFGADLVEAFGTEYGITPGRLAGLGLHLTEDAISLKSVVVQRSRESFISLLEREGFRAEEIEGVLRNFLLMPRSQWEAAEKPFRRKDWSPWRFRRRLSLMCRPIVQISPTQLMYAPAFCEDSFRHVVMESYQGAFENEYFDTAQMKRYIGGVNGRRGLDFNKAIADIFASYGWNVRTELQMTELGAPPSAASGDIDVFAWKHDAVWMCECKELLFARTVGEVSEQLTRFRGATGDELDKHMKRARWVLSNLNAVTQITGSQKPDIRWPLVTSKTVPMQFIQDLGVEVVPADQVPTLLTD
jgi:hypothetical protein